ncbi:hypothetical protein J5N97_004183 [Dioscorea zingiberensis]|uniref:Myb/SANT-like domain-containing protein n=1 Tax=Dioscorea zingiberensis TaxID=325984 RepID=A0A9D5D7H6_9LILI|nr:hypothetical protein J5N97_004183 [Dioscorea zingiberensis]
MRTLKQKYQDIKKLMNLSGVGWNNAQKMLVLEDETYRTYVERLVISNTSLSKPSFFTSAAVLSFLTLASKYSRISRFPWHRRSEIVNLII